MVSLFLRIKHLVNLLYIITNQGIYSVIWDEWFYFMAYCNVIVILCNPEDKNVETKVN